MDPSVRLRTLSALHYAYGAIVCFSGLALLALVFIGTFMGSDWLAEQANSDIPAWVGTFLTALGWVLFALVEIVGILNLLCGSWLARRTNRTACMVVAAVDLLNIPLGLLLGVFTLVSLNDERVSALFQAPRY
ncbi:MAG: hypothetical protein IPJ87_06160 [Flavobacteriales bacterium]|nr:hypothetical protein [Flavobacteriales bacterium]MBK7941442.1 hypothetical protein [Flavobacteriales bacterium]MBK8949134.1 hypothetical protein [Flavobacteriales bacterium]MBK9701460.1 hypothetical protein [Flavobacteriales bacterium]